MSLFKYYSPKKYNFAAIAQHQLFFCRPSGLNDPYDTTVVNINAFPGFCKKLNIKDRMFRKSLDEHTILNVKLFQATPYVEDCNWTVRLDDISTKTKKP